MIIHFDENDARIDDEFVKTANTRIRISEIQQLTETEDQPGAALVIALYLTGVLMLVVFWLPAPIENAAGAIWGFGLFGFGWYRQSKLPPKRYHLKAKASFTSQVTFTSEDQAQAGRFREALETAMSSGREPTVSANPTGPEHKEASQ